MKSDTDLIGEALVESAKKRTSTGQIDAVTHNTAASILDIDFSMQ